MGCIAVLHRHAWAKVTVMSGDQRRSAATKTAEMKIVTSHVPRPIAEPSTWRTWVLLLERSDAETESAWPTLDIDGDDPAF